MSCILVVIVLVENGEVIDMSVCCNTGGRLQVFTLQRQTDRQIDDNKMSLNTIMFDLLEVSMLYQNYFLNG